MKETQELIEFSQAQKKMFDQKVSIALGQPSLVKTTNKWNVQQTKSLSAKIAQLKIIDDAAKKDMKA